jgi:hypothetical protein
MTPPLFREPKTECVRNSSRTSCLWGDEAPRGTNAFPLSTSPMFVEKISATLKRNGAKISATNNAMVS